MRDSAAPARFATCGTCGTRVAAPAADCPDCEAPMYVHAPGGWQAYAVAGACPALRCRQGHVTASPRSRT